MAYCGHNSYMNQVWPDVLEDFVPTKVLFDGKLDDTEGFIGYLPSDKSIYVVFKGTESITNWITDMDVT